MPSFIQYQVDAFSDQPFRGNPAAVVLLTEALSDEKMQSIANENNLSETAFVRAHDSYYDLRWFTPTVEVDLCGHATLAAAHVLYHHQGITADALVFKTRSGELTVSRSANGYCMDFPAQAPSLCTPPATLLFEFEVEPVAVLAAVDYVVVLPDEDLVRAYQPNMAVLSSLPLRGVIVTARSEEYDFVSRFFAPNVGVAEDPVTGSAHCQLAPYWAKQLAKDELQAWQCSTRGGEVHCRLDGDRVYLMGRACTFLEGRIRLP